MEPKRDFWHFEKQKNKNQRPWKLLFPEPLSE